MTLARILVFALALTHAVGLADLILGDACAAQCVDDACGTDCPACRCHGASAMPLLGGSVQAATKLATPREVTAFTSVQRIHASPATRWGCACCLPAAATPTSALPMTGALNVPPSDDELDLLDDRGLDLDRVLGLLHGVLVAPGMIPPSRWVPLAFAEVSPEPDTIQLLLRLYNQVNDLLRDGRSS